MLHRVNVPLIHIGFLVGADKVKWRKQVVPGDRLDLHIEIIKMSIVFLEQF